ncbi:MAG: hypothetical protein ABIE42_09130 [Candidatus Eisenbacteria bacterium]
MSFTGRFPSVAGKYELAYRATEESDVIVHSQAVTIALVGFSQNQADAFYLPTGSQLAFTVPKGTDIYVTAATGAKTVSVMVIPSSVDLLVPMLRRLERILQALSDLVQRRSR